MPGKASMNETFEITLLSILLLFARGKTGREQVIRLQLKTVRKIRNKEIIYNRFVE